MSHVRASLSASRRHKLFSVAAFTGLLGLASAWFRRAPQPPAGSGSHRGSISLWQSGQALSSRTSSVLAPFERNGSPSTTAARKQHDTAIDAAVAGAHLPSSSRAGPRHGARPRQEGCNPATRPVLGSEASNYGAAWNKLVTYNGKLYGFVQRRQKNTIWYNRRFALRYQEDTTTCSSC